MASQIITLNSPTTGLFCFQKFVHDNPPKFRHNGLLRGESIGGRWFPSQRASNVEGVSTPWRLMITYKRHRYMWNNIHLIIQIVCMRIPDNTIFWVVGLEKHGIYIYTFRIVIYVIIYYSTRKFAMKNEWWLFTLIHQRSALLSRCKGKPPMTMVSPHIQNRLLFCLIGSVNDLDTIACPSVSSLGAIAMEVGMDIIVTYGTFSIIFILVTTDVMGDNWCGRFGLWPFRSVAVSVCGRSGL